MIVLCDELSRTVVFHFSIVQRSFLQRNPKYNKGLLYFVEIFVSIYKCRFKILICLVNGWKSVLLHFLNTVKKKKINLLLRHI